jgi:hypothetical protein
VRLEKTEQRGGFALLSILTVQTAHWLLLVARGEVDSLLNQGAMVKASFRIHIF